jgi:D-lactate dehydrogenase
VLEILAGLGVKMIALRCAGFDRVDLDACTKLGIQIARVPVYSPNSVAEMAVALMLCINRCASPVPQLYQIFDSVGLSGGF